MFGQLSNSLVLFFLSPGKMLLTMFLFQKWLGSPFPEDVWAWWLLIHWLQLQFTPCESLKIGFAWQYSQACSHPCCLCTLHWICFDTALLEQPPRSVLTLCVLPSLWRVSMIIFWTIAKSAVFPVIVLSKNKRFEWTRDTIYTVWMVIYRNLNVNIKIFWDTVFLFYFMSCKLSSSKLKQKKWNILLYM